MEVVFPSAVAGDTSSYNAGAPLACTALLTADISVCVSLSTGVCVPVLLLSTSVLVAALQTAQKAMLATAFMAICSSYHLDCHS